MTQETSIVKSALATWDAPAVPVDGSDLVFPVRHIYCVGRNYAEHAKEMGGDATKEPPFFFTKPADAIVPVRRGEVGRMAYPLATASLHLEIEMVVAIGKAGVEIAPEHALEHVYGYATGLDMTRRDLQNDMKALRRPWDIAKSFAQAAPIGAIVPVARGGHRTRGAITLDVNGERRQTGDLADMIWDVAHTLSFLSRMYELLPGDLVYSGTPSGVGAVVAGDRLDAHVDGLPSLAIEVVARR
jgi:fumarylpyruvate hydrolase